MGISFLNLQHDKPGVIPTKRLKKAEHPNMSTSQQSQNVKVSYKVKVPL